ncbi:hypothetical protein [Streptomyces sp. NPDC050504]|uniref:hypothetical protein n=1 Tax=Streptomyces sp. NPDC050504 TaxID=3365618 RepID=UPI00378CF0B6
MVLSPSRRFRAARRTAVGFAAAGTALLLATPSVAGESVASDVPVWAVQDGAASAGGPAAASAAGVATGTASTLSAAAVPPDSWCANAYGSKVCFQHDGDVVWVLDTVSDGMSAVGGVYTNYGRAPEACRNKAGAKQWVYCDKDYAEDGKVRLRALRYDGDTGKYYQPQAYSAWLSVDG